MFNVRAVFILVFRAAAILVPATAGQALPQPATEEQAVQRLTGGTSKAWTLDKIVSVMGSTAERCESQLIYNFSVENNVLTITECKDGKAAKSRHNWQLRRDGTLDILVTVDNLIVYKLSFRDIGAEQQMRLRSDPSQSKIAPDVDMIFNRIAP